jgi:hypothetical protein
MEARMGANAASGISRKREMPEIDMGGPPANSLHLFLSAIQSSIKALLS